MNYKAINIYIYHSFDLLHFLFFHLSYHLFVTCCPNHQMILFFFSSISFSFLNIKLHQVIVNSPFITQDLNSLHHFIIQTILKIQACGPLSIFFQGELFSIWLSICILKVSLLLSLIFVYFNKKKIFLPPRTIITSSNISSQMQ